MNYIAIKKTVAEITEKDLAKIYQAHLASGSLHGHFVEKEYCLHYKILPTLKEAFRVCEQLDAAAFTTDNAPEIFGGVFEKRTDGWYKLLSERGCFASQVKN